jgi:hypothetical protein
VTRSVEGLRWVERNEDKPHRCPECDAVATWGHYTFGPRTRFTCPKGCGVQWRIGMRSSNSEKRSMKMFMREGMFP